MMGGSGGSGGMMGGLSGGNSQAMSNSITPSFQSTGMGMGGPSGGSAAPSGDGGFMSQLAGSQVGSAKMDGSSMGSVGGQSKDMYGVSTSAQSPYSMMAHLNNVNPVNQPQPEFDPKQLMSLITMLTGRG